MSQHIIKMYNKIDAQIRKAPTNTSVKSNGLIPKRDSSDEDADIIHYIKQLRKMREGNNESK